jgi:hypothetical protein
MGSAPKVISLNFFSEEVFPQQEAFCITVLFDPEGLVMTHHNVVYLIVCLLFVGISIGEYTHFVHDRCSEESNGRKVELERRLKISLFIRANWHTARRELTAYSSARPYYRPFFRGV